MTMMNSTVRKSTKVVNTEAKEAAAAKYSTKVSKKAQLVAAYKKGYANTQATYSDTYQDRKGMNAKELEQFYAGWYARNTGEESEF